MAVHAAHDIATATYLPASGISDLLAGIDEASRKLPPGLAVESIPLRHDQQLVARVDDQPTDTCIIMYLRRRLSWRQQLQLQSQPRRVPT